MRLLKKGSLFLFLTLFFISTTGEIFGQVRAPRSSPKQSVSQTVGDSEVKIVYHRPSVKGRKIWGELVPYGKVWRAGANENTTFEVTNDSTINGQKLPKGKYGFHIIPNQNEWTLIFSKVNNAWGSFSYKQENDALRVSVKPVMNGNSKESLSYTMENVKGNSVDVILAWEKASVSFNVNVGDVNNRILTGAQRQMVNTPIQAANFVLSTKQTDKYKTALGWLDTSLNSFETYFGLFVKSRLLAEMGKNKEAIIVGNRAIAVGKKNKVNPNSINFLQGLINQWKKGE